ISIKFGIWVIVLFQAVNPLFAYLLNSYYTGRFINYPVREQLWDVFPVLFLNFVLGIGVWILNYNLSGISDWLRLILGFGLGIIFYLFLSKITKLPPFMDAFKLLQSKIPFRLIPK